MQIVIPKAKKNRAYRNTTNAPLQQYFSLKMSGFHNIFKLHFFSYRVSHGKVCKVILLWCGYTFDFFKYKSSCVFLRNPIFCLPNLFLLNQCCTPSMVQFAKHFRIFFFLNILTFRGLFQVVIKSKAVILTKKA